MAPNTCYTREHFEQVLEQVKDQVFAGKGKERHGLEENLQDQPWVLISQHAGSGFLLGQTLKKLLEIRALDNWPQKEREALGAIVYLIFWIMKEQA